VFIFPIATLLSKLDGFKSPCIINVKTNAVFKVGILQCITVILLFSQISALLFLNLYCTVLYCTVLYCTVLYCTVLYCTVLYCNFINTL
jgi:hypothetical protein